MKADPWQQPTSLNITFYTSSFFAKKMSMNNQMYPCFDQSIKTNQDDVQNPSCREH